MPRAISASASEWLGCCAAIMDLKAQSGSFREGFRPPQSGKGI